MKSPGPMKLYNTLTRKVEDFTPNDSQTVSFYHCGPTVYWTQHIGNLRGMTMADLIRRSIEYTGYNVTFVRNYTDVGHLTGDNVGDADTGEDRMEKGARREQKTPKEIADKYIAEFENDTHALNIIPPTQKPRATAYISSMIDMVQQLLDKGYAYTTPKAIYFDVSKFPTYTKLSGQKLELNEEGAGSGEVYDPDKRHASDFAVWIFRTGAHKNALQYWASPFESSEVEDGYGFPGWHIECSAMALKLLGKTIDIHMGGVEHIPIHHTNEIAQSEAANGERFVKYWLHNEHLTVDGKKMAKSEGTSFTLSDLQERGFDPIALRYFFLQSHYRSKQNFTWESLTAAQTTYNKLRTIIAVLKEEKHDNELGVTTLTQEFKNQFKGALNNDINIPQALAIVWDMIHSPLSSKQKYDLALDFDKVLGLGLKDIQAETIPREIEELAMERLKAKAEKNFAKSDELRAEIENKGYIVEDTKEGYKIKKK